MDKNTFLKELSKGLSKLPNKEKKVLIDFYSELIDDKIECGQSEAEGIESFGSINVLAERLLMENPNRKKSGCLYSLIGILAIGILGFMVLMINFSYTPNSTSSDLQKMVPANENDESTSSKDGFMVLSYDFKDFDEVSLEADASEIIVTKSSDNMINIKYKEYDDEINRIEQKGRMLEFENELKTNKPNREVEHKIYLEIPEDYNGGVDISANLGAVKMKDINLAKIDLSAGLGTTEIENCTATDIDLSSDMGKVSVKNTVAMNSIEASTNMGAIEVLNIDGQMIELSTDMGSIKGNILGKQDEYTILNELGMGSSNISDQDSGSKFLKVSTSMGSVNLTFGK